MNKLCLTALLGLLFNFCLSAQDYPPIDWYHQDSESSEYPGLSIHKAYNRILKKSQVRPVVVAILDTGVDVLHEDLKGKIWSNPDEIPENGIDDDENGYVDDIHGWNFIGSHDGENVRYDTYEVTRLYVKLKEKYAGVGIDSITKEQRDEYELFLKCKEEVETKRRQATEFLKQINSAENHLLEMIERVDKALEGKELNLDNLNTISEENDPDLFTGISFLRTLHNEYNYLPSVEELKVAIRDQFKSQKKPLEKNLDYSYNPEYNSRSIIGDNYDNPAQRIYGNNNVKGERSAHGTHVAGIIGAVRNNELGIDGIAEHVRIMSVRMLPDGDERDKDVANAIRYAVENGASIINMSFGKYFDWNKEVVDEAVQFAEDNDVLIVHAAGNEGFNNDTTDHFPTRHYKSPKGFLWFKNKCADNWIEVGALSWKKDDELVAPFSNYGKTEVDVFAPGMFISSAVAGNEYEIFQGTSMAAPMIAGIAAVIRSYFPEFSASEVKNIIMESSTPLDMPVKKPGTNELVPFGELSRCAGLVNLESCILLASQKSRKSGVREKKIKPKA